jgi:hypothetical protein
MQVHTTEAAGADALGLVRLILVGTLAPPGTRARPGAGGVGMPIQPQDDAASIVRARLTSLLQVFVYCYCYCYSNLGFKASSTLENRTLKLQASACWV